MFSVIKTKTVHIFFRNGLNSSLVIQKNICYTFINTRKIQYLFIMEGNHMDSKKVLKKALQRNQREYEIFLILIAALEIFMILYGAFQFDLHQLRRRIYFCSYIILLFLTAAAFFINRFSIRNNRMNTAAINAYVYNTLLVFWSTVISALDIMGDGYPITYITILAAVGSVMVLPPLFYYSVSLVSCGFMIFLVYYSGSALPPFTFFLNLLIFLLVMFAVESRNYRSIRHQYMMTEKLEEWARIDMLTHIANRRSLDLYLEELSRNGCSYTFALLDADHFKYINDTYGHTEGDSCLIEIARVLTEVFGDNVFRYGGDEFAVVSFENAAEVAEKMQLVNSRLKKRPAEYKLQISSGIFCNSRKYSQDHVIASADSALYRSKHSGKSRPVIYDQDE